MFVPYYTHALFDPSERTKCRERWTGSRAGGCSYTEIVERLLNEGAEEGFLHEAFGRGELPILDHGSDLRGFHFWKIDQDFRRDGNCGDNFKGLDLSYSEFWHCHFKNAVFYSSSLAFTEFYNCTFEDCAFAFTGFLGAKIRKSRIVRCDFAEPCSLENVSMIDSVFDECFLGETTPFRDCFFDDLSSVRNMRTESYHYKGVLMQKSALAGYFASFQSAYEAAGAEERALRSYFEGRKAFTRYNTNLLGKLGGFAAEIFAGYGVKPLRAFAVLIMLYVSATAFFAAASVPLKESLVLAAGALFTFGAGADRLMRFGYPETIVYICLSFSGIALTALFVTTLANRWFRGRIPSQTIKSRYDGP